MLLGALLPAPGCVPTPVTPPDVMTADAAVATADVPRAARDAQSGACPSPDSIRNGAACATRPELNCRANISVAAPGCPADGTGTECQCRDGSWQCALEAELCDGGRPHDDADASVFACTAANGRPLRVDQAEYDHCNTGWCRADGTISSTARACGFAPDGGDADGGADGSSRPTCDTFPAGCVYVDPGCSAHGDFVDQDVSLCFMSAMVPYCGCDGVTFYDYPCARRPFLHWEACDGSELGADR